MFSACSFHPCVFDRKASTRRGSSGSLLKPDSEITSRVPFDVRSSLNSTSVFGALKKVVIVIVRIGTPLEREQPLALD
jgi:hypothetical protein